MWNSAKCAKIETNNTIIGMWISASLDLAELASFNRWGFYRGTEILI